LYVSHFGLYDLDQKSLRPPRTPKVRAKTRSNFAREHYPHLPPFASLTPEGALFFFPTLHWVVSPPSSPLLSGDTSFPKGPGLNFPLLVAQLSLYHSQRCATFFLSKVPYTSTHTAYPSPVTPPPFQITDPIPPGLSTFPWIFLTRHAHIPLIPASSLCNASHSLLPPGCQKLLLMFSPPLLPLSPTVSPSFPLFSFFQTLYPEIAVCSSLLPNISTATKYTLPVLTQSELPPNLEHLPPILLCYPPPLLVKTAYRGPPLPLLSKCVKPVKHLGVISTPGTPKPLPLRPLHRNGTESQRISPPLNLKANA